MKYQVEKRNGQLVPFEIVKIRNAIQRAFDAQSTKYDDSVLDLLALRATAEFEPSVKRNIISVEEIQDAVEVVLIQAGYSKVARAYILYRKQHEKARNALNTQSCG